MLKKELRTIYKNKREALDSNEIEKRSLNILDLFTEKFELRNKTISIFLPIKKAFEINTFHFLKQWQENPSIKVTIPKSDFSNNTLTHHLFSKGEKLELNSYGIPEPINNKIIDEKQIDIVIVPLFTIDKNGNRVGYGKGFYDRFLNKCKKNCLFIGINLFEEIEIIDNVNKFDIKLDYCITPKNILKFPLEKSQQKNKVT